MSNDNNGQIYNNDIISLSDILNTLKKHIKLFLFILVIGVILSIGAFLHKKNNYAYTYYIKNPEYFSGDSYINLIPNNQLNDYLNFYLDLFIKQAPPEVIPYAKRIYLESPKDKNKPFIPININGHQDEQKMLKMTLDSYLQYSKKNLQTNIIEKFRIDLNLRKTILENEYASLEQLQNQLTQNSNNLKQSLDSQTQIKTKKAIAVTTMQSAALVTLGNNYIDLSNRLINLNTQIKKINLSLDSIQNIQIQGPLQQSITPVGITKRQVLILSIIAFIILAFILVFIVEQITNLLNNKK
ncbi:hypothetical protein L3V82_00695 [Thiotrichales bacterium 19S3-7]|nr:hypothetical protein [Thiotrichales bacterium 19S3-7]MCF6800680.1 hypothetical protein [Thiotrichales bacterium 19S3-11]